MSENYQHRVQAREHSINANAHTIKWSLSSEIRWTTQNQNETRIV